MNDDDGDAFCYKINFKKKNTYTSTLFVFNLFFFHLLL